jgi:hypothetical protein
MPTTELERAAQINADIMAADKARQDEAEEAANHGKKLDVILEHLDSLGKRMDVFEGARKDAERLQDPTPAEKVYGVDKGEDEDPDAPRPIGADSRADSIRADAEEIAHFKKENGATRAIAADSVLAAIQSDADRASTAWGKSAPPPGMVRELWPIGAAPRAITSSIPPRGRTSTWLCCLGKPCAMRCRKFMPIALRHRLPPPPMARPSAKYVAAIRTLDT